MLLRQPSVFLQTIFHISNIQLRESLKAHIKVGGILQLEHPLPFLRFFLCGKATLAFLFALTFPVHIPYRCPRF